MSTAGEVYNAIQAQALINRKRRMSDDTPQTRQNHSASIAPTRFSQRQNLANGANMASTSGVPNAGLGSEPAAPAVQHASGGLFGGGKPVPSVPAVHNATQPSQWGISSGHSSGSNLFGGETKLLPGSTSSGGLFGSGIPSKSKPNGGGGLFSSMGQVSNPREGGAFSHIAPSVGGIFSKRAEQKTSSVPDVRVTEGQAVNFGSNILKIHVGDDERARTFTFHSDLLTARSPYFKDFILSNPEQNAFHLPDINPRAFALYFQLVYTGRLPSKSNDSSDTDHDEYALLCKLYTMAHSVKDTKAANSALNAIFAKSVESARIPSNEHVWIVYAGTHGPCGARRMMVDFYTYEATGDLMKAQGEDSHRKGFPPEFWNELAMSLVEKRGVPDRRMTRMNAEQYHGQ